MDEIAAYAISIGATFKDPATATGAVRRYFQNNNIDMPHLGVVDIKPGPRA